MTETNQEKIEVGDVVQADPTKSRWGAVFVIVTDVKPWGIQGYFLIPGEPKHNGPATIEGRAYVRIPTSDFVRIGKAAWLPEEFKEEEDDEREPGAGEDRDEFP